MIQENNNFFQLFYSQSFFIISVILWYKLKRDKNRFNYASCIRNMAVYYCVLSIFKSLRESSVLSPCCLCSFILLQCGFLPQIDFQRVAYYPLLLNITSRPWVIAEKKHRKIQSLAANLKQSIDWPYCRLLNSGPSSSFKFILLILLFLLPVQLCTIQED